MSVESRNGGGEVKEYQVRVRHLTKTRKESWETVHPWDGEKDRARKVYKRFQKLMRGTSGLVTWEERIVGPNFGSPCESSKGESSKGGDGDGREGA